MSAYRRRPDRKFTAVCDVARRRVVAVLACIDVLLPGIDARRKKRMANKILMLCDGKDRQVRISPAQVQEIVLAHIQCIDKDCPMLIFAEPLSRELNEFFEEE
jgi:hypothetical protein